METGGNGNDLMEVVGIANSNLKVVPAHIYLKLGGNTTATSRRSTLKRSLDRMERR